MTRHRWKPNVTVAAVIEQDGRFMLVEEETSAGLMLNTPAGHLDPGESPLEGCAREALEETAHRFTPTALVSPFDPIVWFRPRTERIFDFHYRIEIYTPAHKRSFGYYVLPFLHRGRIVGRVDLKSDRAEGVLRVHGAFAEKGADVAAIAPDLAAELRHMAAWLGLGDIVVARRGEFAAPLAKLI